MITIYKYRIPVGGGVVELPNIAEILSVGAQGEDLFLWVQVNTDTPKIERYFEVFGTGHEIDYEGVRSRRFIGTAFMGPFVWHVFERI